MTKKLKKQKQAEKAEMIIKVNSLSDKGLIKKLYEAAEAGVEIKMIEKLEFSVQ